MTSDGGEESTETLLDGIGPSFSRLRPHAPAGRKDISRNLVLNIVADTPGEITVGAVAEELKADPSVASRMVSDCIAAGYLLRAASQADGRRTVLHVTPEGQALRKQFARSQRDAFERVTADWPDSERLQFARLLHKYVEASAAFRKRQAL
ncbi:MarR family winged helix-turn-helix transcriptional regulator [Streptomyces sp. NPDC007346]|uniref:MarR family winged helix-turn-helix transcriptional regulator n=1 Tax=Streptomyces sp. NPDC007346 TaxID=3154682 RepID=UPI003453AAA6